MAMRLAALALNAAIVMSVLYVLWLYTLGPYIWEKRHYLRWRSEMDELQRRYNFHLSSRHPESVERLAEIGQLIEQHTLNRPQAPWWCFWLNK